MRDNCIRFCCAQRTAGRVVLLLGTLVAAAAVALAEERAPVPDDAAQAKALELVHEVYGRQSDEAMSSAEKAAVAKEMLDEAAQSKDDPASHFVLLGVARDMAVEAGEAGIALQAVDEITRAYQVDGPAMKLAALLAAAAKARSSKQRKAVVEAAIPLIHAAVDQDDYATAKRLAPKMLDLARRSRDRALLKKMVAIGRDVAASEKAHAEAEKARAVLEDNPIDPYANLTVGLYTCLAKGDWEKGIAMLALGTDARLKALAIKELEGTTSTGEEVALGDGWWELAQGEKGDARKSMMLRAGSWYQAAQAEVSGLVKVKLDRRLEEIRGSGTIELPRKVRQPVFKFDDEAFTAKYWVHSGEWNMADIGGTAPRGPASFLRTRHAYKGDLAIDMDFSFGQASYTNTGGCWITVWGKNLGISNAWHGLAAKIQIHREGDEIVFVHNGQEQRIPVEPSVWSKPTVIEIHWRSRASHFRRIEIKARTVVALD